MKTSLIIDSLSSRSIIARDQNKACTSHEKKHVSVLAELWLKCDFKRPFSLWNVLNGRDISVTIQLTFIADSAAFKFPFSNFLFKKLKFNYLSLIKLCRKI